MQPVPLARIALQPTPEAVVSSALAIAHRVCGAESAFAAVRDGRGRFPVRARLGLADVQWSHIAIREGRGLGGQVMIDRRPRTSHDYLEDTSITADYQPIMRREGLHGLAVVCVDDLTARGPGRRPSALLYVSTHSVGAPGDRVVDELQHVAEMAAVGLAHLAPGAPASREADHALLTARELEVLRLLGRGLSNRGIGAELVVSETTVKAHLRAIFRKLDVRSRLAAVIAAHERGVL